MERDDEHQHRNGSICNRLAKLVSCDSPGKAEDEIIWRNGRTCTNANSTTDKPCLIVSLTY